MRLSSGDLAPPFDARDFLGGDVSLAALRGGPVLLSFYRYASCPICNMRMRELIVAWPRLQAAGLSLVAVFESPAESVVSYVGRHDAPFPIVPDPARHLYRRFGVERGWTALFKPATIAGALRAFARGHAPGRIDGAFDRLPADFLLDAGGRIVIAPYGRDLGDHVPLTEVEGWLAKHRPADRSPHETAILPVAATAHPRA